MLSIRVYFLLSLLTLRRAADGHAVESRVGVWSDFSEWTRCGPCGPASEMGTRKQTRCCLTAGVGACTRGTGDLTQIAGYECETVTDNTCPKQPSMAGMVCGGQGSDLAGRTSTKTCELYVWGQPCQKAMPDLPCISAENPILVYDDATPATPKLYACMNCDFPLSRTTCYKFDPTAPNPANAWVKLGTSNYPHRLGVVVGGKIYLSNSRWEIFDPLANAGAGAFSFWPRTNMPYISDLNACMVTLTVNAIVYIYICGVGYSKQNCVRYNIGAGSWDNTISITLPNSCPECTCVVNPINRNQIVISQQGSSSAVIYDALLNVVAGYINSPFNLAQSDFVEVGRDGAIYAYNPLYAPPTAASLPYQQALKYVFPGGAAVDPTLLWQTPPTVAPTSSPFLTTRSYSSSVGVSLSYVLNGGATPALTCTGI